MIAVSGVRGSFTRFGIGVWAAVVLTPALVVTAARARDSERVAAMLAR
jgi:hypothetical protein